MGTPGISNTHVNSALRNLATVIASEEPGFVALKIAPPFPVDKITDIVWKLDIESMFRADDTREGPDGYLGEIRWLDTNVTYTLTRHGRTRFVSDVHEASADPMVKPSRGAQRNLVRRLLNSLE